MEVLFLVKQQPALLQIADDVLVAILDPAAAAVFGAFVGELAVGADGVDKSGGPASTNSQLFRSTSTSKSSSPNAGA